MILGELMSINEDRGSITLVSIYIAMATILMSFPLFWLASAALNFLRVTQVADVVALSAARQLIADDPNPCNTATQLAELNGATLMDCTVLSNSVQVKVGSALHYGPLGFASKLITASANAGLWRKEGEL